MAKTRILVLGAGFGGLELASILSDTLGEAAAITLIDQGSDFVFGNAKLEYVFGRRTAPEILHPYARLTKPSVRFRQETILSIDPVARSATTDAGRHEGDFLVVALGAAYGLAATPGLGETGHEFYSLAGVERLRGALPDFTGGRVVVGVCGAIFKCPPAPSEAALMMHDYLAARGLRTGSSIDLVVPSAAPVPPSSSTSEVLLEAFTRRGITFHGGRRVASLNAAPGIARLDDGSDLPCDLFLGVPEHRAPQVVLASGLAPSGWIATDRSNRTAFPGVFAIGDVTAAGHKSGVAAEAAARVAAEAILAAIRAQQAPPPPLEDAGSCHIEFAAGLVGRFDIGTGGSSADGRFHPPSPALHAEKHDRNAERISRWFGV